VRTSRTEISRSSPDSCASVQRRDAMALSKDFAFSQNCCCFTCAYVHVIPVKPVLLSTIGAMCSWVLEVPWGSARAGGLISAPAAQRARLPPRRLLKLMISDQLREMSIFHPQGDEKGWSRGSCRLCEVNLARFALPSAAPGLASPSPSYTLTLWARRPRDEAF